jgi:hypothetical protein
MYSSCINLLLLLVSYKRYISVVLFSMGNQEGLSL